MEGGRRGAHTLLPSANEGGAGEEDWGARDAQGRDGKKGGAQWGRKVRTETAGRAGAQWGPQCAGAPIPRLPLRPPGRAVWDSGLRLGPVIVVWVRVRLAPQLVGGLASLRTAILIGPGRDPPTRSLQSPPPRDEPESHSQH